MSSGDNGTRKELTTGMIFGGLVLLVITILIVTLIVQFAWNISIADEKTLNLTKPITFGNAFGLFLLGSFFFGGSNICISSLK